MASSPFSSESNSIRNSPDPATLESFTENKLGLRYGDEHWRDKAGGAPHPDQPIHPQSEDPGPGNGPGYFQGTYQVWLFIEIYKFNYDSTKI